MKKLLFILFFPITVPIYIFVKLVIFTVNVISDHFIPFLQYDIFPRVKQYFQEKSAKMQKNAEKALADIYSENESKDISQQNISQYTVQKSTDNYKRDTHHSEPAPITTPESKQNAPQKYIVKESKPIQTTEQIEERVYILFYTLGSARRCLQVCTSPDIFFKNYDTAINVLCELTNLEQNQKYDFYTPFPSEQLAELKDHQNYIKLVNDFIKRYWYRVLAEAKKYKSDASIIAKIQSFSSSLSAFDTYLPQECKDYIQQLSKTDLDIHNLPQRPKTHLTFNTRIEKQLLTRLSNTRGAVKRHFCYNDIIDFYYKYRNDYPKAALKCLNYCVKDIQSIPDIQREYIEERIASIERTYSDDEEKKNKYLADIRERGFRATMPAFDRITMLFLNEGDYDSAIYYCRLAIENNQDTDLKFTKRIDRIKKKRAAEEKSLYGSELLHSD